MFQNSSNMYVLSWQKKGGLTLLHSSKQLKQNWCIQESVKHLLLILPKHIAQFGGEFAPSPRSEFAFPMSDSDIDLIKFRILEFRLNGAAGSGGVVEHCSTCSGVGG